MSNIGNIKTIFWGAIICLPYIIFFFIPALSSEGYSGSYFFTSEFGSFIVILFSLINGLGKGIFLTA
jgi:hypothetical protein